ncbi:unnamed protein product, partial [Timema podura]|nr:unnamed protein product [Timema podura]
MAGVLLQEQEWGLLVRLLTGMRRFTDMVYIFHALKENDRFESLLGQGMDKVPGLQIAILDYLERYYAEDKDTIRITALHFKMYSRVATQYIKDGQERTLRLKGSLANTEETRALLTAAMLDFSQAAQYYLQANTLTKAMWASHQAELVALQISLLNMLAVDQTTTSILQLDTQAITDLINTTLSERSLERILERSIIGMQPTSHTTKNYKRVGRGRKKVGESVPATLVAARQKDVPAT